MEEDPARAGSSGSAAAAGGAGGMSSAVASPSPRESWENDRAPRTHHVNAEEEDGVVSIPQGVDMHTLAVLHPPTIDIAVLDASVESKHSDEGEDRMRKEAGHRKHERRANAEGEEGEVAVKPKSGPRKIALGEYASNNEPSPLDIIEAGGKKKRVGLRELKNIVTKSMGFPDLKRRQPADALSIKEWQALSELMYYIRADDMNKCKQIVKREKINLNSSRTADTDGKTPLHVAASHDARAVTEWLIKEGVEVNPLDSLFRTPLFIASAFEFVEIQRMLIAVGGMIKDPFAMSKDKTVNLPGATGPLWMDESVHWLVPKSYMESNTGGSDYAPNVAGRRTDNVTSITGPDECDEGEDASARTHGDGHGDGRGGGGLPSAAMGKSRRATSLADFALLHHASSLARQQAGGGKSGAHRIGTTPMAEAGNPAFMNSLDVDATEEWEMDPADLESPLAPLGSGAFGEVFKTTWRGVNVACKRLKPEYADDATALSELRVELATWCRLHHPNICHFLGAVTRDASYPCTLVSELCENGGLQQLLIKHAKAGTVIPWDLGIRFAADIANGMYYLHSRKPLAVMHRDLKPANCLIDASNHIKLTDFGLSKLLAVDHRRAAAHGASGPAPTHDVDGSLDGHSVPLCDKKFKMTGETGAYKYMAPEVVRHERYSLKCDVYSFAILAYEIFEGIILAQNAAMFAAGAAGPQHKRPECAFLKALGQKRTLLMEALIHRCWSPEAVHRPTFQDISKELREIRKLQEWDMPDKAQSARKSRTNRSGKSGAGNVDGECCVVQ